MSVGTELLPSSAQKGGARFDPAVLATVGLWLLVFAIALAIDRPVSVWAHVHTQKYLKNHQIQTHILRFFGNFWFTIVVSLILLSRAQKLRLHGAMRWRDAAIVFLAGLISIVSDVLKWCFGRSRPFHGEGTYEFHPLHGVLDKRVLSMQSLSFPSGDATLAFVMVISLSIFAPRWRALWWALGIIVILERLAEGAHYPSDTVAGAALGLGLVYLVRWIVDRTIGWPLSDETSTFS